jgi:hypothetical protein
MSARRVSQIPVRNARRPAGTAVAEAGDYDFDELLYGDKTNLSPVISKLQRPGYRIVKTVTK